MREKSPNRIQDLQYIYTHAAKIPSQALTVMASPFLRSGTVSSDIILRVLFLLIAALPWVAAVHEPEMVFYFTLEVV